ncbi:hypothetical protein TrRE_jg8005 [Triparma retinervis]|uniref:Uncharacterized protein n=1 Tax=Triparma retinervis TaxID=2557542 RepID=A0A9W7C856_9STRA|nr:hypothetical protein TrRE_jg8005 [Triparma retinervis]
MKVFSILGLASVGLVVAQIPCDEEYGKHCPDKSSWDVGECIREKVGMDNLSDSCKSYLTAMSVCKDDIAANCANLEFTGEVIVCMLNWTSPSKVSSGCMEALSVYKEKPQGSGGGEEKSEEDERRAKARRRRRNRAAGMAREQKDREKKKDDKKARRRRKIEKEL